MSSAAVKDLNKSIEAALEQKRDQIPQLQKEVDSAQETYSKSSDPLSVTSKEFLAAQEAVRKLGAVKDEIQDLSNDLVGNLRLLGEEPQNVLRPSDQRAAGDPSDPRGGWDAGRVLTADVTKKLEAAAFSSTARFGRIETPGFIASREQFLADIGSSDVGGLIQPDRKPMLQPILQPLRLLNLISKGTTDSNLFEYVQMVALLGEALETAEGTQKPELEFDEEDADGPVRTIAGYVKVRKQTLADSAGLRSILDTLLKNKVWERVERQVGNGNGVGQNLRGIRQTPGILQNQAQQGDTVPDTLLRAMTMILLTGQFATGHAMNPLTIERVRLMRENSGGANTGNYVFGHPSQAGPQTMWGAPMVPVLSIPDNNPLTGAFDQAQLLVREGVKLLFSDSDSNDFTNNRVTILGEGRFALAVWRPDGFVDNDLTPEEG